MAKSTRRTAGCPTPDESDPSCLHREMAVGHLRERGSIAGNSEDRADETRRPEDPEHVALSVMLSRALDGAGLSEEAAGRDGIVVLVSVPSAGWVPVALEVWKARMRRGERYQDGFYERAWIDEHWCAWAVEKADRHTAAKDGTEFFARAVAQGQHCAAFTPDPEWLPADIVHGADHHLVLPPLTGADVSIVAREVCNGDPADALSDGHAAALTPRLLRLARRPGQDADAYLRKLRGLIEREAASVSVASTPAGPPRDTPTLDRLHGMDEAVAWGLRVNADLLAFKVGTLAWADVDRGCLLSGPPGCGKTLFARALAATCGVLLVTGSYGEWHGSGSAHQGDLLKAMRRTFRDARDRAPCILFIDEIDSFPNRGTVTHHYADWVMQVVNALLAEVDGVGSRDGVVLVAACNHPEKLDPALVRSGRLDRHVRIRLPDRGALARILREHLGADLAGEDLGGAALAAFGASGADCERLVRGARRRAREAGRTMALADLMGEIDGAPADHGSPEINDFRRVDRSGAELWLSAVHEAGHAVAGCELTPGMLLAVSVRNHGDSGGSTVSMGLGGYLSAADLHRRLMVLLAGRAAEQAVIGEPSSAAGGNAESDLAVATGVAAAAAASLGLDEAVGLVWSGVPDPSNLRQMLVDDPVLAARVRAVLDGAYADALALMRRRQAAVEALARVLIERRALDGGEAATIVADHPADDVVHDIAGSAS